MFKGWLEASCLPTSIPAQHHIHTLTGQKSSQQQLYSLTGIYSTTTQFTTPQFQNLDKDFNL